MSPYAACILASFFAGYGFIGLALHKKKIEGKLIFYYLFLTMVFTLYGAKLFTVINSKNPEINVFNAGLSSLGGAIGMLVALIIFAMICPTLKSRLTDAAALALPLMYGVSKLGCHLAGCCYGIPYEGFLCIYNSNEEVMHNCFPVALTETVVFLMIFTVGIVLYFKKKPVNFLVYILLVCSSAKFLLDYLRDFHIGKIITANQAVCMGLFAVGVLLLMWKRPFARVLTE